MESTNLQIVNTNEAEMESTDLNYSEFKVDPISLNSDVIGDTENNNGYESEDDDIELQQILFYSAQFHSGRNLESRSNHAAGKKVVEMEYSVIDDSLNLENSTNEIGESSCTFCEICENAFPLPNTLMQGTNCNHRYCEECIQNYIGKRINKDIHEVIMKCPVSACKEILDVESITPVDFLAIDCPFMDCTGTLVDDHWGYPIRACTKCWRIFCIRCRDLHLGMTYEDYQYSRQLDLLYWQQYGGYHDEHEEEEEKEGGEEEGEETP